MLSNKSLRLALPVGIAMLAAGGSSHAASQAPTPSFAAAIAPDSSSTQIHAKPEVVARAASTPAAPASQVEVPEVVTAASSPVSPDESHLTLRDIDNLARNKLTRSLRGDADTPTASGTSVMFKPPAPVASTLAPPVQAYVPRERTTPVSFVGGYVDDRGQHVLYEYNGAVYPARVGEKLLNGWVARGVDGLWVTVAQGKHTWRVPMSGRSQDSSSSSVASGGVLGDLSSPLPAGVSLAQPISGFGRQ
ncbi:hypothetical protein [Paraburkholderia oxyphila]|uniref:hypothetical protein n=1 Tax=Paraburkholderia oxyphila TaxID=614212 RepID=UPI0012ED6CF4|nr:hypothetical protein [Paraburkholderia oxyphila]